MNITYLDADTREVIDMVEDPALAISGIGAEQFAASLRATVVRICPTHHEDEWQVELHIPIEVRRLHTPLTGDRVRFTARIDGHELELSGTYQGKRHHSYVISDDGGGEWTRHSMWEMKKV